MKDEFKPLLLAVGALLTQLGSPNAAQAAQTPEPLASQPSAVATPQGVRAVAPLQTAQTGVRPLFLPQPVQVQPGQLQVQPGVLQGLPQASHVNSGPTGHANTGGHANFSREQFQGQFRDPRVNPGGFAGSHANSGPTGHANVPGHANFNQQINP
uniref:hypothetical protein n=1 Tax=Neomegalonema perideroedes TaxID=217219 RepID=UPI0005930BDB